MIQTPIEESIVHLDVKNILLYPVKLEVQAKTLTVLKVGYCVKVARTDW